MARLSARDERRARDVAATIAECRDGSSAIMESLLPSLREFLDTAATGAYSLARRAAGLELSYFKSCGLAGADEGLAHQFGGYFRRVRARRGLFDPWQPAPSQLNRVVSLPLSRWCSGDGSDEVERWLRAEASSYVGSGARASEAAKSIWTMELCFRRIGRPAHDQLRVLLSDGERQLAWLGAFQAEPFSERQRLLLERIVEPLRERLTVERRAGVGLEHAAMMAALEYVPAAAYVLDGEGRVAHANAVGRARLDRGGDAVRASLSRAIAAAPGKRGELAMTKLTGEGLPPLYLAIGVTHGERVRHGIERARDRWGLTAREAEILAELAAGRSNRDIAEKLAIAPRTVEVHISSILRKAHADSRSQLIVDLWQLADS